MFKTPPGRLRRTPGGSPIVRTRLLVLAALLGALALVPGGGATHAAPAAPLEIQGDAQLADAAREHGWRGRGTADEPYVIDGLSLRAPRSTGLALIATHAHVVVRRLSVVDAGDAVDGIRIDSASNVTVVDSTFESVRIGILVRASRDIVVANNSVAASSAGLALQMSTGVEARDNRFAVNDRDVALEVSAGNRFERNNLSIATGQFGFHFADEISYANILGTSNVVNFVPVQWYAGLQGTPDAPVRVKAGPVRLAGMTNVAQVVIAHSEHVHVDAADAKDGARSGVLVLRSHNVTLAGAVAEGNAEEGLAVRESDDVTVVNGTFRANGAGIVATATPRLRLDGLLVERNDHDGLVATRAPNLTLTRTQIVSNGAHAARLSESPDARIVENAVLSNAGGVLLEGSSRAAILDNGITDNGAVGLELRAVDDANVSRNRLRAQDTGIALASAQRNVLRENEIAFAPATGYGLRFDDEVSWDNAILPDNLANDVPVRWIANAHHPEDDPLVLSGIRIETRTTNVAGVMVFRASGIRLEDVTVLSGAKDGVRIHGAANVTLLRVDASRNQERGIHATDSDAVLVERTTVRGNGAEGLLALATRNLTLRAARLDGNGLDGARIEDHAATLDAVLATGNGATGATLRGAFGRSSIASGTFQANRASGLVLDDADANVTGSSFSRNAIAGLELGGLGGGHIEKNRFQNHSRAIQITATDGLVFRENLVAARPGQLGFHFADEASWRNDIDVTNLVNAVPMRWYVGVTGTPEAPVRLGGFATELGGLNNVAQVFLLDPRHVVLHDVAATNGTGGGILAVGGTFLGAEGVVAANNAADGFAVRSTWNTTVIRATLQANVGAGLHTIESNLSLREAQLAGNAREGLLHARGVASLAEVVARDNRASGAVLVDASNVTLTNSRFEANGDVGARILSSVLVSVEDSTFADNDGSGLVLAGNMGRGRATGIDAARNGAAAVLVEGGGVERVERATLRDGPEGARLVGASNTTVEASTFVNLTRAVVLQSTTGDRVTNNTFTLRPRQVAVHFEDETSYANHLGGNLVNGRPIHFYHALRDAELRDVVAEGQGGTNAGQIVLHRASNVTLVDPLARGGRADGLVILNSQGVRVIGGILADNRGGGARIVATGEVRLDGVNASENGGDGLTFVGSPFAAVENATMMGNLGAGVSARDTIAPFAAIANRVEANRKGGILLAVVPEARVEDNAMRRNGPTGIEVVAGNARTRIVGNELADHDAGIRIVATSFASFVRNAIDIEAGQVGFHFADEASYDNDLPPSNTVDGEALQWHRALAGTESAPIVLRDVRVTVRGITNVAQVMVYRSAYVSLPGVVAENGVADGLLLHRSSSVMVDDARLRGNDVGAHLVATQSSLVRRADVAESRVGVHLAASGANTIEGTLVRGTQRGILMDGDGVANRVSQTQATGARGSVVEDPSVSGLRGANLVVDAGPDVRNGIGRPVRFEGALVASRFDSERIVHQRWDYGDGSADERAEATPLRPSHLYAQPGTYTATLTVRTAEGRVYSDTALARISGPLSAPLGVAAVQARTSASLSWQPPASDGGTDVVAYRVYRGATPEEATLLLEVGNVTHALDEAVPEGVFHHYAVAAVNGDSEGPRSAFAQASAGTVPGAPSDVVAEGGDRNVTLRWTPPTDVGGLPITGYEVFRFRDGGDAELVATPTEPRHLDTDVDVGALYGYEVNALNALGNGPPAARVTASPTARPSAPTNVSALAGDHEAMVTWTPVADDGVEVLHHKVYREDEDGDVALVAVVPVGGMHRDTSLSNTRSYRYHVSAVTAAGEGPRGASASVEPGPVDEAAPVVVSFLPPDGAFLPEGRHELSAFYADGGRHVLAVLAFDGREVARAEGETTFLSWTMPASPPVGVHSVLLRLRDAAGNEREHAWGIRILSPDDYQPRIAWTNVSLAGNELALGDEMTASVRVDNLGLFPYTESAKVTVGDVVVAEAPLDLAPGDGANLTFSFKPPQAGRFQVVVGGGEPLPLEVISLDAPDVSDKPPGATNESAPPGEDGGFLGVPLPAAPLSALAVAAAALARRRRA